MNLRPHHLLCIQKFTGHGYSEEFTAYMSGVVSKLRKKPDTSVTIVHGCDDLCEMCPNNKSGACSSLEKVNSMDSAVLSVCSIEYGVMAQWAELSCKAREHILETDEFKNICSCCGWFELCRNTEVSYE